MHILIVIILDEKGRRIVGSEKYAKHPLLYIYQPHEEELQVEMQHQYIASKSHQPKLEEEETTTDKSTTIMYKHHGEEQGTEVKEKKFRDMTVEEQLEYLARKPDYDLQVTYEITSVDDVYVGAILQVADESVILRRGRRRITIPKEKITKIRIIGF